MISNDLVLPVYLDSSNVFDLLAIFEDGISFRKAVNTISSNESSNITAGNIGLPVNNLFGLFNIAFGISHERKKNKLFNQNEMIEKVHTTVSLFNKLRKRLLNENLLLDISDQDINILKCGDFIEFETILKRNPIVETFQSLKNIMELATQLLDEKQIKQNPGGGRKVKYINNSNDMTKIIPQLKGFFQDVTKKGFIDLIGTTKSKISAVLSTTQDFYINKDSDEVLDGNYKILGKIIRIIKNDENINLLRKTSFNKLQETLFDQFGDLIKNMGDSGIVMPELITKINGPTVLIKTIGIFISLMLRTVDKSEG
jgi:hypothetical protein